MQLDFYCKHIHTGDDCSSQMSKKEELFFDNRKWSAEDQKPHPIPPGIKVHGMFSTFLCLQSSDS